MAPSVRLFGGQDYAKLRKACKSKKQLFVDTVFPPTNDSLFLDQGRSSDIVWKRPAELVSDPRLFVEGASANDVTQGVLGNCWFVSACSALTHNDALLNKVIPYAADQEWSSSYAGIFRFRFWRFGQWIEVCVDDLLPTRDGKLLFARSKTDNEFWSALLEKAFAKLYGCYENLVGGHLSDALQDVSGGVAETINVHKYMQQTTHQDQSSSLFHTLKQAFDNRALIVAAIAAKTKEEIEETLDCGLVKGHAYAVTAVRLIELDNKSTSGGVAGVASGISGNGLAGLKKGLGSLLFGGNEQQPLIRLQNPWGEREWNGPWSDDSLEWEQVTSQQKASLGITVDEDGEFWMPWNSFVQYFTDISVCQLFNTNVFSLSTRYHEWTHFGEWSSNGAKTGAPKDRAGGCMNFPASCCSNPQFIFDISDAHNEFMFALTQKELNEGQKRREPYVTIGMHLMKVESNRKHRIHQPIIPTATSDYSYARSVMMHCHDLQPGRYILLATTFAPREQTSYLLRIFSSPSLKIKELHSHAPRVNCCLSANSVTRVLVKKLHMHNRKEISGYVLLHSRGDKCRTSSSQPSTQPDWNEQFVFHRREARQEYRVAVYSNVAMRRDELIGTGTFHSNIDNDNVEIEVPIKNGANITATLFVSVASYDDPLYV